MEGVNKTEKIQFFFRPFSTDPKVQIMIFAAFLVMYLTSLGGNATIAVIVQTNHSLHTPMYFFLANLAVLEMFYTFSIAPLALANLISMGKTPVSITGCGTQMFFFVFLGGADCVLLAVMAYDRFIAICYPLRYTLLVSWPLCVELVVGSLALGFLLSLTLTALIFHLPFCNNNEIYHFYCDMPAVMRLACADTHVHETALYIISFIVLSIPLSLISISYVFIVAAILRIRSAEGRHRAFSTCSSHIVVVLLQYGCTSFIYLSPHSSYSPEMGRPFSPIVEVQLFIFAAFLLMYIGSLVGNSTIFLTVWAERSLHTPMYFFLANLAVLEIFYSSTVAPLALVNLLTMGRIPISFTGCGTQMFFFVFLGSADCILLGIMAYDRFVAIRDPLRYILIMRWQLCAHLALGALVLGFILALQLTVLIFHLPFCGHNRITHFYCDVLPILRLACGDTRTPEAMIFIVSVIILTIPFSLISISYIFIVSAILKIRSAEGRHKAFSTCSSHLTVVLLQYGCCSLIYLRPSSSYNPRMGRVVSVVYTFVTPLLNPLIYSMRNKELKDALSKPVLLNLDDLSAAAPAPLPRAERSFLEPGSRCLEGPAPKNMRVQPP
ncbi:Olfactory receptor 10V1, partial [Galemys pyrenaicus]